MAAGCLTVGKMAGVGLQDVTVTASVPPTTAGCSALYPGMADPPQGILGAGDENEPAPFALPINTLLQFPGTLLHKQWPPVQLRDSMCLFSLHVPASH